MNNDNNNNKSGGHITNDDQNKHGGTRRFQYEYLKPDQTTQLSFIIFALDIWYFEIKSELVKLLSKFHGWI